MIEKFVMFPYGKLVDLLGLYDRLVAEGLSIDDLRDYLAARTKKMQERVTSQKSRIEKLLEKYAVCPDCGAPMRIFVARGGPIQTRFACTQCDLALDSQDPPSRWIHKFMESEEISNVQQIDTEKQADTTESGNDKETSTVGGSGKVGESNASSRRGKSLG